MSSRFLASALLACVALPLSSCGSVTYGQRIDADKVAQIERGVTTRAQVTEWFGQPMQSVMMPDGGRTMYFVYSKQSIAGGYFGTIARAATGKDIKGVQTPNLSVVLDQNGIVKDYEYSGGSQ